jgi:amino acid permease
MLGLFLFFFCYKQDVNIIKSAAKYAVFAVLSFFVVTIIDFIYTVLSQNKLIKLDDEWNKEKKDEILYGLNNSKYPFSERLSNIITALSCIILSYSFHIFTFSIYGCMGKISRKQFFITTSISVLITTVIYLICGTIGYLLYYDYLTDSILDAVQESWLSSLLSLANVVNVIMTFPITFSAVKNYFILFVDIMITLLKDLVIWIFSFIPKVNRYRSSTTTSRKSKIFKHGYLMTGKQLIYLPNYVEFFLTVLIYFLVFLFASMYTKLKVIFSFTGGVMGNILSFIFPSIFYLYFSRKKSFTKYGFIAIVFIIFGIVTMSICIMSTIQSL